MTYEQRYFVHLIVCAILGKQPNEPNEDIVWKSVYENVVEQSLFSAFYNSLLKLNNQPNDEVLGKLKKVYSFNLNSFYKKEFDFDEAIDSIADNGVKVLPLKGYFIKNYYPKKEFRFVSDLDVFTADIKQADKALKKADFKLVKDDEHHLIFEKNGSAVELHKTLFVGKYKKYFLSPFENAFKVSPSKPIYKMDDNYFYAFFIAHFAHHFFNGGIGLRSICDLFLLNKNLKIDDKSLINECGLALFEEKFSEFANDVFNEKYDEEIMEVILSSNTSGNNETGKKIDVANNGKTASVTKKIFPSYEYLSQRYPIKSKMQLPFYWVKRFNDSLHRKAKVNVITDRITLGKAQEEKYINVLKKLGIKE